MEIEINRFDQWPWGKELVIFYENIPLKEPAASCRLRNWPYGELSLDDLEDEPGPFFARGKFFIFMYPYQEEPNPTGKGIKLLMPMAFHKKRPPLERAQIHREHVERVIKMQKILHSEDCAFDCSDDIIEITVRARDTGDTVSDIFAYETDTSFTWKDKLDFTQDDATKAGRRIGKILKKCKIRRKWQKTEISIMKNYIKAADGKLVLIDIDPRCRIQA